MYYAESSTDKHIREKFFKNVNEGCMVEVGAGPVEWFSMSKHFRDSGWRCICIDPNPHFVNAHKEAGNEIYQNACSSEESETTFKVVDCGWHTPEKNGVSYSAIDIKYPMPGNFKITEIPVKVITLNSLLESQNITSVDFVSVDTEGWEIEVMEGFDIDKYKPKVILLENYLHEKSYNEYMDNRGYKLDSKIEHNYVFIKK